MLFIPLNVAMLFWLAVKRDHFGRYLMGLGLLHPGSLAESSAHTVCTSCCGLSKPTAALQAGSSTEVQAESAQSAVHTAQAVLGHSDVVLLFRLAAAVKRDKYEQRHMGSFRCIYPSSSASVQAKYEWLLQGAARLFASSMKAKAYQTIGRIQVRLQSAFSFVCNCATFLCRALCSCIWSAAVPPAYTTPA